MKIAAIAFASVAYLASLIPAADADAFSDMVLSTHNSARARYGARPLQWSAPLVPGVVQYAQMCRFAHSDAQSRVTNNTSPLFPVSTVF